MGLPRLREFYVVRRHLDDGPPMINPLMAKLKEVDITIVDIIEYRCGWVADAHYCSYSDALSVSLAFLLNCLWKDVSFLR